MHLCFYFIPIITSKSISYLSNIQLSYRLFILLKKYYLRFCNHFIDFYFCIYDQNKCQFVFNIQIILWNASDLQVWLEWEKFLSYWWFPIVTREEPNPFEITFYSPKMFMMWNNKQKLELQRVWNFILYALYKKITSNWMFHAETTMSSLQLTHLNFV